MGGTTSTSGWALFWFLAGFTTFGTGFAGAGALGFAAGIAMIVGSGFLFVKARQKEEA